MVAKRTAAQTNSATTAMPTIDNHSKVNPLSGLDRSTSTVMLDLPKLTPEPNVRAAPEPLSFNDLVMSIPRQANT